MTNPKLRITILAINYSPEPTGNAPYTTSLAEGLAASGHSVRVIAGYPHYPEWRLQEGYTGWTKTEVVNGVRLKRLRHHIPRSPSSWSRLHMELSFGLRLMFARWGSPDVVLVVSPALFSSALAILRNRLRLRRPPVGIWVQDIYSRGIVETGTGTDGQAQAAAHLESLVLRSADGVVVIHERFQQFVVNSLQVPSTAVEIIRNWTHLPPSPTSDPAEMRTQLGWSEDDIVVLHAGNMGKKQGLENVIEAARLAQERQSKVRFVLMGDGNQRRTLEAMAGGLSSIQFVSPLPGEAFMMALVAADILLVNELPGVKDMSVPSKLTSYFNAGNPVIAATDDGSVTAAELNASHGGIRVNAGDPSALLESAEVLGADKERAKAIGARGLKFRHETLSKTAAVGHYDDFITSLAMSRGR
ncbi:glycosyltransferase family 4 protein [Arthrobacter oryzae]|uniref:glycosyltransferase family 4 protein n=1 Tax=Arthrobacter oryzae TaxID=409290 RepID=UPI00278919EB|nr:glycosyltransferase family 4 protein [Arthrobacter oryzae]MDQ0078474.1 glycosyltransferase involved in cell wall biosynthesis [Arthrobacter oryzae]